MRIIIGSLLGAVIGFGYYKLFQCSTGTCPITSNPWGATLYGAVIGFIIATSGGRN